MTRRVAVRGLCAIVCALVALAPVVPAAAVERSLRPEVRPDSVGGHALPAVARQAVYPVPGRSLRPQARPGALPRAVRAAPAEEERPTMPASERQAAFEDWLADFRARARGEGISPRVLDAALGGLRYDASVIDRDRNQSEFTRTLWEYLDSAVSGTRIANGRKALDQHGAALDRIEARYGVEKEIVAAIWGLESAYGAFRGETEVIEALATLAFDGRRGAFFESELIAALKILQAGDTTPDRMTGSWAGAMGHTQFMPSSYLAHAEDFTGDGRRDIWGADPTDALASAAAYLAGYGWTEGQPWGVEVRLPEGFDYRLAARDVRKRPSDWARLGVRDMEGRPVPDHGQASLLLPAGARGPAFLIFDNFRVIERYNPADAYVIAVGHLADRLAGGPPIRGDWPRGDRALTFDERKEMQRRLTAAGFDTRGIDGRIGPLTIAAVRDWQAAQGLAPDGYASLTVLERLR
ncbi:lytic murein transglycosylase [Rhodosalinus sp.]|uniref:lytic murein transglycosylase n=1 Tax=Rhodosalinus sp. TaxID=2047741 RepID=UPI003561D7FE